jgi:CRP-like cAMP-binding protein
MTMHLKPFTLRLNMALQLVPGQFFGELALLEPETRSSTVTCLTTAELLVLRRNDFADIIRDDDEAMEKIKSIIASLKLADSAGISSLRLFV